MNRLKLIKILEKMTSDNIEFSIDISTGEDDAFKRVYASEYLEHIDSEGTILLEGEVNGE